MGYTVRNARRRELTRISKPSQSNADHAQHARNKWGDVLTVYHFQSDGTRQSVAITLGRRVGSRLAYVKHFDELAPTSQTFPTTWNSEVAQVVASPDSDVYAGGDDNVKRPTITALNDGSFMLAWCRFSDGTKTSARIETARVTCRDPKTGKHEPMVIERLNASTGYPIANLDARGVEGFPSIAPYGLRHAIIIWGDTTAYATTSGPDGVEQLGRIRRTQINWNADPAAVDNGPTGSKWRESAATDVVTGVGGDYYDTLPIDNMLLPEIVASPDGTFFIAFEEYQRNGHNSWVADQGFVRVKRVQGPFCATPWANISADALDFQHTTVTHQLRRVQLAVAPQLSEMGVLANTKLYLTCGRLFTGGANGNFSRIISYDIQGGAPSAATSVPFGANDNLQISRPTAVCGPNGFAAFVGDPFMQGSINKRLSVGDPSAGDTSAAAAAQEFIGMSGDRFDLSRPARPHVQCDYVPDTDTIAFGMTFEALPTGASTSNIVFYLEADLP